MNIEKIKKAVEGTQRQGENDVLNSDTKIHKTSDFTSSDTEIFAWCFEQHLKRQSYTKGSRNAYIVGLANFCNEYGVTMQTCISESVNRLKQPDQSEIIDFENVIQSAYRNHAHAHGTKQFEPNKRTENSRKTTEQSDHSQTATSEQTAKTNLQKMLSIETELRKRIATDIEFSKPILLQNDNAVIFPNTINVIQGQSGSHKSRLAELIASAFIKKPDCQNTLLGYTATPDKEILFCYVDTERNLNDQLPYALQSIQLKAGYSKTEKPENYTFTSLLEIERKQRFDSLKEYINDNRDNTHKHIFLILDVITDCIGDFNKVDETMQLIDLMNISINKYDMTFLCIIHENPGTGQKARGHLGTEIMNKASTVMQVGFEKDAQNNDTDVIRVKYLKTRSTKRHDPFYVKYSDTDKGLILATDADVSAIINSRKHKADINDVIFFLETYIGDGEMKNADLLDKLCKDIKAHAKTVSNRLSEIIDSQSELVNSKGEPCILAKRRENKAVIFYLKPIPEKTYTNPYDTD